MPQTNIYMLALLEQSLIKRWGKGLGTQDVTGYRQQHDSGIERVVRVEIGMYANHFSTNGPTNNSRPMMQQSNQSKKTNM